MKQRINLIGGGFQHDVCSSSGSVPTLIEWVKGTYDAPISIYLDHSICTERGEYVKPNPNTKNYAWVMESKTIIRPIYDWCLDNVEYLENNFEMVFTHDMELVNKSPIFKLVVCNALPWVKDCGIWTKTKSLSMIASSKVMCEEHKYRQEIIKKYQHQMDHYGRGFRNINIKEDGLKDYRFSITMENGTYPLMYSEKLTDCFATGTIPIYYGCDVSEVFDTNGIIMLTDDFDPNTLTEELYFSKIESIKKNYEITMNLPIAEDYIYEKYIK
jgi:hypothetical protein